MVGAPSWEPRQTVTPRPGTLEDGVTVERSLPGVGMLRFEDWPAGTWATLKGEASRRARRRYLLNGEPLDSVTQIVGCLDKPALYKWMEAQGIRGALELVRTDGLDSLSGMLWENVVARVRERGLGADAARGEAADRGTAMHAALEALAMTGDPPNLETYPEAWRPWMMGATRLWDELRPEAVASELIVCHPTLRYAGRLDLLCWIKRRLTLLDYKSGKGRLYSQAHWQSRGYAEALTASDGDGPVDVLICGVDDAGGYQVVPCDKSAEDWAALVHVYRANKARTKEEA